VNLADHQAVDVQRDAVNPEQLALLRLKKSRGIGGGWPTHLVTRWSKLCARRENRLVLSVLGMALYSGLSFGVPVSTLDARLEGSALTSVSNQVARPIVGVPSRFLWDENGHVASESSARGAIGSAPLPSIQKSLLEVDHEMPAYRELLLSRFLWEGSDQDAQRGEQSPGEPLRLARYLWDESADRRTNIGASSEPALARYLWDEPKQAE